jgi:septal ring factor EnvC (AmiA/AmiB activator)
MKKNKRYWLGSALVLGWITTVAQPSKTQFEAERAVLLQRIKNIQQVLLQTETKKREGMGQLNALNTQIESNALLIQTIGQELSTINQEIQQRQRTVARLAQELAQLQKEYAAMVYVASKALHDIHTLMFIFAAPSFHNLVQRLRYVKQYARIRQKHFLEIEKTKVLLQAQQVAAKQRMQVKNQLLHSRQAERSKLNNLKTKQAQLISKLAQQHTQLTQELQQRNKAVQRLDKLITDIIQQALQTQETPLIKKLPATQGSPTAALKAVPTKKLTALFRNSRGKLLWPVKSGFISRKFGISPHPVLRNVQVENLGIDIHTQEGAQVYAIFEGVVKAIAFVPGVNRIVIIQHGAYHSVYAKLKHTTIKVGQYVQAHTPIGTVYTDAQGTTELQLQLWQDTQKLNPAWWLSKK